MYGLKPAPFKKMEFSRTLFSTRHANTLEHDPDELWLLHEIPSYLCPGVDRLYFFVCLRASAGLAVTRRA
ncbi:MAG: hypothetical protein QOH35_1352 [Acidobacteriaceae bacterium]|nr:hypothetical protein [Acidobacteriaceae bacterium]